MKLMSYKEPMPNYSYDRWDEAAEQTDLDEPTRLCDGCQIRILCSEVVSPAQWSEAYCPLCFAAVREELCEDCGAELVVEDGRRACLNDDCRVPEAVDAEETREAAPVPLERWVDLVRAGGAR
jgi:hypothetical protein